jgi:hypothetical protein
MQPKFKFKKTLLASALLLGLGNAFHASSDTYTVSAETVADVTVTTNTTLGATQLSFGTQVKVNPAANSTCIIKGASVILESELDVARDADADGTDVIVSDGAAATAEVPGDIGGTGGCIADADGDASGSFMVFDIDAANSSTVSVSIPDVVGTGWTYSAGAESCVMKYNGGTAADFCDDFGGITQITGVRMQAADTAEFGGAVAGTDDLEGTTRLLLAGTLTFDGTAVTAPAGEQVTVTIVYE